MSFENFDILLLFIFLYVIFTLFLIKKEVRFFKWVSDFWIFNRTRLSKFSSVLYLISIAFFVISLGDFRGKEEIIRGNLSTSKTLLLIDASSSMLAEDVRPSRFKKAIQLAKHFVKKAAGQEVSIVVFSDTQKRIIPFTNDLNLVEARLGTLEGLDLQHATSNISLALMESVKYFESKDGMNVGNILLITDGEEHDLVEDIKVPDEITVVALGVGTNKGAVIPIRDSRGAFRGNKKFNNETVITRLNENYFEMLSEKIKNFNYWIVTSYAIPTESVLDFFNNSFEQKILDNEHRVKPVLANYLLIPAMLLLCSSFALRYLKIFKVLSLFFVLSFSFESKANQVDVNDPVRSEKIIELEDKLLRGNISAKEKKKLAQELLKEGFKKESALLYDEILDDSITEKNKREFFNKGVAEFESGQIQKGIETYKKLLKYLENNPDSEMYENLKKNLINALQEQMSQSQQSKDDQQESSSGSSDDQSSQGDDSSENNQEDSSRQQKPSDNESRSDEDQSDGQDESDDQESDERDQDESNDKESDDGDKDESKDNEQSLDDEQKKELPNLLKQLMSDDNKLQKQMIDADTKKQKPREVKDW